MSRMAPPDAFVHDTPAQRVVFGSGALEQVGTEAERLGFSRALVLATPGSGARLGARVAERLGSRGAGVHARAALHVPAGVAAAALAEARALGADGLVAVGGGSAIGLAKAVAHETGLAILAVPTTYSGSEATTLFGLSEGERKVVGRDPRVLPRTIIYDPDLTLALPPAVTAASGLNAVAHAVEALWAPERTPATVAFASEALRGFAAHLVPAVEANDGEARAACLPASWLAGAALAGGTGLHHKLAHVLGGLGLPHAETHAIILPHVARFNLEAAPEAAARLREAFRGEDPARLLATMLQRFPIPQRLREVGLEAGKFAVAAEQVAALGITDPRPVSAADVEALLLAAF